MLTTFPTRSGSSPAILDRRGPSWTSSPTPWPRPWPKSWPWPATSKNARPKHSRSLPRGPGPPEGRGPVELTAARSGRVGGERRQLGAEHELIDLARLSRDALAGGIRAGAIRAVALELGAPVDRQQHVARDRHRTRLGMGQRGVSTGRHDRGKARGLCAQPAHEELQLDRDIALAAPDHAGFKDAPQRLVSERGGGAQAGALVCVLDRAHALDGARGRYELPVLGQVLAQARMLGDRHRRVIEAQTPALWRQ